MTEPTIPAAGTPAAGARFAIRPLAAEDMPGVKSLIDATGLFPSEMLDDMAAPFLAGHGADGFWLVGDEGGPQGVAFAAPERMTEGTWNLLLIAVRPERQGRGVGTELLRHVEQKLAGGGERLLIVETSGLPAFERSRAFYRRNGFAEEARIREFYAAGEDKIVFCKALARPGAPGSSA